MKGSHTDPYEDGRILEVREYTITWDPLPCPEMDRLPKSVRNQLDDLYHASLHGDTNAALQRLKPLFARYPNVPVLGNWIASAYQRQGLETERRAVLQELIDRHPDYLFARLGMANLAIEDGRPEEVPRWLGRDLVLPALFLHRSVFHVSEMMNFCHTVGRYHVVTGNEELAESTLQIMEDMDPDHPAARDLRRLLHSSAPILAKMMTGFRRFIQDNEEMEQRRQARRETTKPSGSRHGMEQMELPI